MSNPPIPSIADLLYLLYYPFSYAGIVLLVRARIDRFRPSTSLDGAIAATTSAGLIAALAFESIVRGAAHARPLVIATTLAYPIGDLILLAIAELRRVSGEQFDPAVVEGFVSAWHERDRRRHGDDALDAAA